MEAIVRDPKTGAKMVLEDLCVGCKVCTIACPFGTVNYLAKTGKVQKCDLCEGEPACAEACPTGAITYVDADWTGLGKMRQWAGQDRHQPGDGLREAAMTYTKKILRVNLTAGTCCGRAPEPGMGRPVPGPAGPGHQVPLRRGRSPRSIRSPRRTS